MKFMHYDQNQSLLLPPLLSDCLPEDHICFVISDTVDHLDLSTIENNYTEEGHPAYHPKMMIKLLFYAYSQGVRSSRKIENKTNEDIAFRYLAANTHVDHGTVNLFRKNHLSELPTIFAQIVLITSKLGLADLTDISLDGTKIKAQASKTNLFTKDGIAALKEKIETILSDAEKVDLDEDKEFGSERGFNQIPKNLADPKTRRKEIEKLQRKLADLDKADKTIDRKEKKAKEDDEKNRKTKAGQKEQDKMSTHTTNTTDPDSKLMKMKDGSYKMAYNVQLATANQFIAAYSVADDYGDNKSLPEMVTKAEKNSGQKVKTTKADSAYFNKENIRFLKANQTEALIPDTKMEHERKKEAKFGIGRFDRKNFVYDQESDCFICPEGKTLVRKGIARDTNGREKHREYRGKQCESCAVKTQCTKGKKRYIYVDLELDAYRDEMREKLNSGKGKAKYQERFYEIEPVFGNLKHNQNFTEFLCRGRTMASIELGLASSAHNLKKIYFALKRKGIKRKEILWDNQPSIQAT